MSIHLIMEKVVMRLGYASRDHSVRIESPLPYREAGEYIAQQMAQRVAIVQIP